MVASHEISNFFRLLALSELQLCVGWYRVLVDIFSLVNHLSVWSEII